MLVYGILWAYVMLAYREMKLILVVWPYVMFVYGILRNESYTAPFCHFCMKYTEE